MAWYIEGNGAGVRLGVSEYGCSYILGNTSHHTPDPGGGDYPVEVFLRLRSAGCNWTIYPSTAPVGHLDPLSTGFYEQVVNHPSDSIAAISFHSDPDLVGVTISVSPIVFDKIFFLFESALRNRLDYQIILDFCGFRVPESCANSPSVREFMMGIPDGKAYHAMEVEFQILRRENDA